MRRRSMLAAALPAAAILLTAGCGSVPAGQSEHGSGPGQPGPAIGVPAAAGATAAGNRALARREAARLVARTPLPGGAVRIVRPPHSVSMPFSHPAVASQADVTRVWRLPMSFARARAWLARQRPSGLRPTGSGSDSASGRPYLTGSAYAGPPSRAWSSAELGLEVAPAGPHASVLRADGLVVWLDPVPLPDAAPGPRRHVTLAAGCPATDRHLVGVTNSGTGLTRRLLPAGRPTAGLECRYYGMNGHPWRLHRAARLSAAAAGQLAARMSRLPLSHAAGGVTSCPMDDGSAEIVALAYPGRGDVDLWVTLNGCTIVSNGHVLTAAAP